MYSGIPLQFGHKVLSAAGHFRIKLAMGIITELMGKYADAASHHTGLHYVPSFNDLNSNSADDVEEEFLEHAHKDKSRLPEHTRDENAATTASSSYPQRMSNKEDDSMPGFDPYPDFHKVVTAIPERRADWVYDRPRGPDRGPSVWQYILKSRGERTGDERLDADSSFRAMDTNKDNFLDQKEIQAGFGVNESTAAQMVKAADKDRDNRLSYDEYEEVLKYGPN